MLFLKVLNQVSYSLITLFMVFSCNVNYGLPSSTVGNNQPAMQETRVPPVPGLGRFPREGNGNPLEYSFWEIPWTEEAAGLQSMGSKELDTTEQLILLLFSAILVLKSKLKLKKLLTKKVCTLQDSQVC